MTTNLTIRQATPQDTPVIHGLIRGLAEYEKRPQDMTATVEQLHHWLFERMAAGVLIAEIDGSSVGYALYYPIFGSFAAAGRIYLEDLFVKDEYRGNGFGRTLFMQVAEIAAKEGYSGMEWSCLDWNKPSIEFYNKLGAATESGRVHFDFDKAAMDAVCNACCTVGNTTDSPS